MPYFRYLVAPAVEHLDAARAATEPKQKKRKKDRDSSAATAVSPTEAALHWRLRLQVNDAACRPAVQPAFQHLVINVNVVFSTPGSCARLFSCFKAQSTLDPAACNRLRACHREFLRASSSVCFPSGHSASCRSSVPCASALLATASASWTRPSSSACYRRWLPSWRVLRLKTSPLYWPQSPRLTPRRRRAHAWTRMTHSVRRSSVCSPRWPRPLAATSCGSRSIMRCVSEDAHGSCCSARRRTDHALQALGALDAEVPEQGSSHTMP